MKTKQTDKTATTALEVPAEHAANVLEAASLGMAPFGRLGKELLKSSKPEDYAAACQAIADGSAVETIIIRIGKDSLAMSFCLLAPGSPAAPALFAITGKAVSESMH